MEFIGIQEEFFSCPQASLQTIKASMNIERGPVCEIPGKAYICNNTL